MCPARPALGFMLCQKPKEEPQPQATEAHIFGGFISLIGAAFYPIYFRPLMRLEEYSE